MKAGFFGNASKPKPKPVAAAEPKKQDIIEVKATKSIFLREYLKY